MDAELKDCEPLANFVLESNKFRADGVSWRQYMPGPDGERSVFRVEGLNVRQIVALGQEFVGGPRGKVILGWGQFHAVVVRQTPPLKVRAVEPPDRHAVIECWPEAKEKKAELAMRLAREADAVRFP